MLKEFVQYLLSIGQVEVKQVGTQQLSTQPLNLISEPTTKALEVRNLTGLVDYLTTNYDKLDPVLVQVVSPTEVNVYSTFNRDKKRNHLLTATALLPTIAYERFHDTEQFNILLQSCFVPNMDSQSLLSVVGNITENDVRTTGDDGVTQTVTAKTGITTVGNATIQPRVVLKPFRTFAEIPQPESQFIFRMKSGQSGPQAAIFEADGGAWKIEAIRSIRDYLAELLKEQIESKQVTIIA